MQRVFCRAGGKPALPWSVGWPRQCAVGHDGAAAADQRSWRSAGSLKTVELVGDELRKSGTVSVAHVPPD